MTIIGFLDYTGVFVFAMSGVLAAAEKRLDLFGAFVIAFVTALGGGTLRDLLLNIEISWIQHPIYIYLAVSGTITAFVFKNTLTKIRKTIFLFDTLGIALFTIIGVQKAMALELPYVTILLFGMMTATFGGVIRDILCNEIPLIFRKEIYATACLAGGLIYLGMDYLEMTQTLSLILSILVIVIIRTIAVVKNYKLPVIQLK